MEGFTERMIKRSKLRSTQHKYFSCDQNHKTEGKYLQGGIEHLIDGIDQKSCELVTRETSCDYESLPIKSPRSYKLGDSFFSKSTELNMMDKCEEAHKDNILPKTTLDVEISRLPSEKAILKDSVEEKISSNHRSYKRGPSFLSSPNPTPIFDARSDMKLLKNNPTRTSDKLADNDNFKIQQLDSQFDPLNKITQQKLYDFDYINKDVSEIKETDILNFNFYPTSCNWTSTSNANKKIIHKIEHSGESTTFNFNDTTSHNVKGKKVQDHLDSATVAKKSIGTSVCTFECEHKGSKGKSLVLAVNPASNPESITILSKHNGIVAYDLASRMNLEKLDDKEDRLSQLDEVNVSAIKLEELNLPGLKLAQIVNERLPVSFTQDLPQPSRSMCKNNGNNHPDYKNRNAKELYKRRNRHSSKRNVTNLEGNIFRNIYDWGVKDSFSSGNYSTPSNSSLNNVSLYSVHSSDISFSCSCSTSISPSSMPEEIPSDSLPYLLLQHLSLGKKTKNDSVKAGSLRMNKGNNTTVVSSGNGTDTGGDDSSIANINIYEEESELTELRRKAEIETIIADQASKALHLCCSSSVFAGSTEQVEGERLLLLSTIRKQAVLDKIQRLKAQVTSINGKNECVEVSIKDIKLLLKDDFMDILASSKQQDNFFFLCLISYQDTVLCTETVSAKSEQPTINFLAKNIKIKSEWCDDLWISFQVYMLRARPNKFEKTKGKQQKSSEACHYKHVTSKRDSRCFFPCGSMDSKEHSNASNSVCGPIKTRVPGFVLIGHFELHLPDDVNENYFILQQYENYINEGDIFQPLHETAHLKISCALPSKKFDVVMNKTMFVQYQGFLTQFRIISGIGAWQRGWWCLKGSYFMCWKYPEDEEKFPPLLILDLKLCTKMISPVSRLKCARSNTFSMKMKAEEHSQVEGTETTYIFPAEAFASETITEHILSADTRGERDDWCTNLNGILMSLQSWKVINSIQLT